ncbi:hypothetical protein [Wansuia hejianensis]|uniref:Lipoprotein n=1 Tax=Wansuia hejianensis TaxID=2763667 RepID=A0A926IGM3_9FIRM|nr:hypothetical protein [Wansuia hejianensis]MBC8589737.1 hypothetical protein [Wansuia hejianensis]
MKRILLLILTCFVFLTGCMQDNTRIINKIKNNYDKSIGYETEAEISINTDSKESQYRVKEKHIKGDKSKLEFIKPNTSKGITIEYEKDKIFLNHASIKQSISLRTIKKLDKGILLEEFFEDMQSIRGINKEKIGNREYYVINYTSKSRNKYNKEKIIYLEKRALKPYMMKVIDKNNNTRATIRYKKFKYIK